MSYLQVKNNKSKQVLHPPASDEVNMLYIDQPNMVEYSFNAGEFSMTKG